MVYGRAPEYTNGFKSILLIDLKSDIPDFVEIGHPIFFFFLIFLEIGQGFMRLQIVAIPNIGVLRANSPPI